MASPPNPQYVQALIAAGEHFTAGRFNEALTLSGQVAAADPANADARHILGLCRLNLGQPDAALESLKQAFSLRKTDGGIANSLALVHLALNDVDAAAAVLEKLARKAKLPPEGLSTLGDCRLRQGDPKKARACFERALKMKPDLGAALVNLGEALRQEERLREAIAHYEHVTAQHPELTSAWRNLGIALQEAERFADSVAALKRYVAARPDDATGWKTLGHSLLLTGDFEGSLSTFDTALKIDDKDPETWNNRALALRTLDRLDEAKESFLKALGLQPDFTPARLNRAYLIHDTDGVEAALKIFNAVVAEQPDDPKVHLRRCEAYLLEGRINEGWDDYKWRYKKPPQFAGFRKHSQPVWNGEDLTGKTILCWGEQGIGDQLMHATSLPGVFDKAEKVVLEVEPRLVPVLERSYPSATVFATPLPPTLPPAPKLQTIGIDYQVSLCELIPLIRPNVYKEDAPAPYLQCDAEVRDALRQRYEGASQDGRVIGLSWHSSREGSGWIKSIPLPELHPLVSNKEAAFVSLQYGDHRASIADMNASLDRPIVVDESVDSLKNMDRFAAQVAAMDLVITTSNTTAHVAGALGVPAWVMVPRLGSGYLQWYWFRARNDSPWYDSMRIYRQTRWHDWTDVIEKVNADFVSHFAEDPS